MLGFSITIENNDSKELANITEYVYLVSVHKVGYFADRPCIFSPKGCENAVFKEVCP
jgi:hypothetical protein